MMSNTSPEKKEENAYFLQVGQHLECGHCHPEKYAEGLVQLMKAKPDYVCDCVCHDVVSSPTEWSEDFQKLDHNPIWNAFCREHAELGIFHEMDDDNMQTVIAQIVAQERIQAKREVIAAILKNKKDVYVSNDMSQIEVVEVEDIERELLDKDK